MNGEKLKKMNIFEIKEMLSVMIDRRDIITRKPRKTRDLYAKELRQLNRDIIQIFNYIKDKPVMI